MALITREFRIANYAEAAFWIIIGLGFFIAAFRGRRPQRNCLVASLVFVLFGISDIVEARTGAYWEPRWLFLWKALCVGMLIALTTLYFRDRKANRKQ